MSHVPTALAAMERLLPHLEPEALGRYLGIRAPELCERLLAHTRTRTPLARLIADKATSDGFDCRSPAGRLAVADRHHVDAIAAMAGAWLHGRLIRTFLAGAAVAVIVDRIGQDAHALAFDPDVPGLPEASAAHNEIKDPALLSTHILNDGRQLLMSWIKLTDPGSATVLSLRQDITLSAKPMNGPLPVGADEAIGWIMRRVAEPDV